MNNNQHEVFMKNLEVTLPNGQKVDFTGNLDDPISFEGSFEYLLVRYNTSSNEDVKSSALTEIENRAVEYANKVFAGYNMRAIMANEAVGLLVGKIVSSLHKNTNTNNK